MNDSEAKEVFKFVIDTHKALSQILRFSTVPTIHKQNVAEHSYFVALIAWLICVRMETKGIEINTEKVLKLSLIHDLPESVCFPAGTKVLQDYQDTKNIEDFKKGDQILSYNEETREKEIKHVLHIGSRMATSMCKLLLSNGNELICTDDHKIYVIDKGWIEAKHIENGDLCVQKKYCGLSLRIYNLSKKGKTFEEFYGEEKGAYLRELATEHMDEIRGLGNTPEAKNRWRETFQKNNELFPGRTKEWKEKRAKKNSEYFKQKLNDDIFSEYYRADMIEDFKNGVISKYGSYSELGVQREEKRRQELGEDEYRKRCLKNFGSEFMKFAYPTSIEKELMEFLDKIYPDEWKYTGDCSFWIGEHEINPDFIHVNGTKKAIEVFNEYWKLKNYDSIEEYVSEKTLKYKKHGWQVLFANWDNVDLDVLKNEIDQFMFNPEAELVSIVNKELYDEEQRVFNVMVEDNFNYFAQGILVHNSGDMPRSVKKGEIRKIITELEDNVFQMMIDRLPEDMHDELSKTYRRWELGDSLEEKVMRFSDILESAIYCLCEKELGNSNMDRIISNMIIWIDGFEDELMKSLGNEYKRKVVCEE